MAHFAKLGVNGKVIVVHVLDNTKMLNEFDNQEDESVGQNSYKEIHGWIPLKCGFKHHTTLEVVNTMTLMVTCLVINQKHLEVTTMQA